jgi:glycosyltransferase involved in cell wall biosynthesis
VELVSTEFIRQTLQACFKGDFPTTFVFPPRVDTSFFVPPTPGQKAAAREKFAVGPEQIHVVYVGRLVVNKGICQLIRMLDSWPIPNLVLTVVGNFDEEDRVRLSVASHKTFPGYFRLEILQGKHRPWLRFQPSMRKEELRESLWSADLYVYPSISPDENFGIASWEAAACGLPVVVTNFGGLHDLAEGMPWQGVATYPTLQGVRFSLRAFHACLLRASQEYRALPAEVVQEFVRQTVNPEIVRANLASALEYLRQTTPEHVIPSETAQSSLRRSLAQTIDRRAYRLFAWGRTQHTPPDPGMSTYGDVWNKPNWPLIYGLYSAANMPPKVSAETAWRGFFRVAPWKEEQGLFEFGFPGPRVKRYQHRAWETLMACGRDIGGNDYLFLPESLPQVRLVQELVNYGYLVPDFSGH